jgi:hypothetical protein
MQARSMQHEGSVGQHVPPCRTFAAAWRGPRRVRRGAAVRAAAAPEYSALQGCRVQRAADGEWVELLSLWPVRRREGPNPGRRGAGVPTHGLLRVPTHGLQCAARRSGGRPALLLCLTAAAHQPPAMPAAAAPGVAQCAAAGRRAFVAAATQGMPPPAPAANLPLLLLLLRRRCCRRRHCRGGPPRPAQPLPPSPLPTTPSRPLPQGVPGHRVVVSFLTHFGDLTSWELAQQLKKKALTPLGDAGVKVCTREGGQGGEVFAAESSEGGGDSRARRVAVAQQLKNDVLVPLGGQA